MSTGARCHFDQKQDGWYLSVQDWPYGEWDEYTTKGPFTTQPEALRYLNNNFANPGGYSINPLPDHVCRERVEENGWAFCRECGQEWKERSSL